jgi:hypothetical protein
MAQAVPVNAPWSNVGPPPTPAPPDLGPGALSASRVHALAACDMLPCAECPTDGWMICDCPMLADGLLVRCPGCGHRFAVSDVRFMDDMDRRRHGLEVILLES